MRLKLLLAWLLFSTVAWSQSIVWNPTTLLSEHKDNNTTGCASTNAPSVGTTSCVSNSVAEGQTVNGITSITRTGGINVDVRIVDTYNFGTTSDKVIITGVTDSANFPAGTYSVVSLGACSAPGDLTCTLRYSQAGSNVSSSGGTATRYAQTPLFVPLPKNVATQTLDGVSIKQMLFAQTGGVSKAVVVAHLMPWFSCGSPCTFTPRTPTAGNLFNGQTVSNSHTVTGYVSNSTNHITAQINYAKRLGIDGFLDDWSGAPFSGATATRLAEDAVADKLASILSGQRTFKFAALIDDSSFKTSATCGTSGQLPSCVEKVIECSLDYMNTALGVPFTCVAGTGDGSSTASMNGGGYFANTAYLSINNHPVTGTFFAESGYFSSCSGCTVYNNGTGSVTCTGTSDCWTKVWAGVAAHISGYAISPLFYWRDSFTHTDVGAAANNGSYKWDVPTGDRTNFGIPNMDTWLNTAVTTSDLVMHGAWAKNDHAQSSFQSDNFGFESYCGMTWVDTLAEAGVKGFNINDDMPIVQLITWNDQEQGTMLEMGIPNCYGLSGSMTTGGIISYAITTTDTTYAPVPLNSNVNTTLDHLTLLAVGTAVNGNDTMQLATFVPPTSGVGTISVAGYGLPAGTYTMYLKLVPKALIQTSLIGPFTYVVP